MPIFNPDNLPNVSIQFTNGAIGTIAPMDDGCSALVCKASTITKASATQFALETPYLLTSLRDLEALGFTPYSGTGNYTDNHALYRQVADFYSEAPDGTHLWLMGYTTTTTSGSGSTGSGGASTLLDTSPSEGAVCSLLRQAQGEVRILMVQNTTSSTSSFSTFAGELQDLCQWATDTLYAPCLAITSLDDEGEDLAAYEMDRLAVVNAFYTEGTTDIPALGLAGGRLAAYPVHHNLARVKNGSVARTDLAISMGGSLVAPELCTDLDSLHAFAYLTPRTFIGLAGQYWNDDRLCTSVEDDYAYITRRRTIDKAYRIAYQTLVTELCDHVPVNDDGTPVAAYCKAIETKVESAIANRMTAFGNLGTDPTDPNDLGVQCLVDQSANILQTSTLGVTLRVKPYGYARYIDVQLGFLVNND